MERGQVLVVAAAVAVVGVFVFNVVSDRTALRDDALRDDLPTERSMETRSGGDDGGGASGDRATSRSSGKPEEARSRVGVAERGSAGSPSGSRARRPAAVTGGHLSGRTGGSAGGEKGEAVITGSGSSLDVPSSREQRRADVMDMLSQPSTASDPLANSGEQEVALEVRSTEDSEQASRREDIDDPDDGDGIKFTDGSQLTFAQAGGATGEAGTISFDVEPEWRGGDATDNSLVQIRDENEWANRLQLVKNGRFLRFILADSTGREADISVPIDEWEPGNSHSVTASWGDGQTSLYIDGRLAGSNTYEGDFNISPTTPLHLGSDYRSSDYGGANATIRGFTLFKNAQHP